MELHLFFTQLSNLERKNSSHHQKYYVSYTDIIASLEKRTNLCSKVIIRVKMKMVLDTSSEDFSTAVVRDLEQPATHIVFKLRELLILLELILALKIVPQKHNRGKK